MIDVVMVKHLAKLSEVFRGDGEFVSNGFGKGLKFRVREATVFVGIVSIDEFVQVVNEAGVDGGCVTDA